MKFVFMSPYLTVAEIKHCARYELIEHLHDICARTSLGLGGCGGANCIVLATQVVCEARNWGASKQLRELRSTLNKLFDKKAPVLSGANLAEEELNQNIHFLSANLGYCFENIS